jgi:mandelate racemase
MACPKIREFRVRAVRVPMAQPHKTASATISESPLVLTDIIADDGTTGHSMIFTYAVAALKPTADLIKNLEPLVKGEPLAPIEVADKLAKRFRLLGLQGLVAMAVSAIDMALWDALARSHNTSLVRLLGSTERPIAAYGAVGYEGVKGSAKAAQDWAKLGFKGVKAKIGYATVEEDLEVVRAMRKAIGNEMAIMVDYNQSLTPPKQCGASECLTTKASLGWRSQSWRMTTKVMRS